MSLFPLILSEIKKLEKTTAANASAVNDQRVFNSEDIMLEINGEKWLKGGYLSTEIDLYPYAKKRWSESESITLDDVNLKANVSSTIDATTIGDKLYFLCLDKDSGISLSMNIMDVVTGEWTYAQLPTLPNRTTSSLSAKITTSPDNKLIIVYKHSSQSKIVATTLTPDLQVEGSVILDASLSIESYLRFVVWDGEKYIIHVYIYGDRYAFDENFNLISDGTSPSGMPLSTDAMINVGTGLVGQHTTTMYVSDPDGSFDNGEFFRTTSSYGAITYHDGIIYGMHISNVTFRLYKMRQIVGVDTTERSGGLPFYVRID